MSAVLKESSFHLNEKQKELRELIAGQATYILAYGGSRSSKTFELVRTVINRALGIPNSRHLIARFRFNHVKQSIVLDTFPKVVDIAFGGLPGKWDKQDWYYTFPNGSQIWVGGLDDKERTEKILGNEYCTILLNEISQISYDAFTTVETRLAQKCFYKRDGQRHEARVKFLLDENPPNKGHWSHKLFIEKRNPDNKKALTDPEDYASLLMNPGDNIENLSPKYLKILDGLPKHKRDRFLLGKFADDSDNQLWSSELLDGSRVEDVPQLLRIVIAVDPSGADDDETKNNDDIGIMVGGLGTDGKGYLLEDLTLHAGPAKWGAVVASAYDRHLADRVVAEDNYGGAMVKHVVKTAKSDIAYKSVRASRGKAVRAEPISALHETGKIKLAGRFDELEDELMEFTTTGYAGLRSPNRADAFVWLFTELFPGLTNKPKQRVIKPAPKLKRF